MLDPEITTQLRARGHDVESIQAEHRDLVGRDDEAVLEATAALGRALVTDNVRHFEPLHRMFVHDERRHGGIVLVSPNRYPRAKRTIGLWVEGLERLMLDHPVPSTDGLCLWLD